MHIVRQMENSLKNKDLCLTDATCYEGDLHSPTDSKLLLEFQAIALRPARFSRAYLLERVPRSKYDDVSKPDLFIPSNVMCLAKGCYSFSASIRQMLSSLVQSKCHKTRRKCLTKVKVILRFHSQLWKG